MSKSRIVTTSISQARKPDGVRYFYPSESMVESLSQGSPIVIEGRTVSDVKHARILTFPVGECGNGLNPFSTVTGANYSWFENRLDDVFTYAVPPAPASMLKPPGSTSGFELLTFLADIDQTIASFTKKYIKNYVDVDLRVRPGVDTSYGELTFGILPMISDLKALLLSLGRIFDTNKVFCTQRVSRVRFISKPVEFSGYGPQHGHEITYSLNGYYTITPPPGYSATISHALYLLDELGVHPDLKTLWDITPLSFVIDYFIPIGDILESLHPRGWGSRSVAFTGFSSLKGRIYTAFSHESYGTQYNNYLEQITKVYARSAYLQAEPVLAADVDYEAPSARELFNTAYLMTRLKHMF